MRVMFAGTPAVAVPALQALHASTHEILGVLTRAPAPVGRKRVLTPSPVHAEAERLGLPVLTESPDSPAVMETLAESDCVAVVAYGVLIKEPALSLPPFGWVNLHYSLLPRWRGAAPVQHAIMAGEERTGVSVFQIEPGLDTGPVFAQAPETIHSDDTAGDLLQRLTRIGTPLLIETLDAISAGEARPRPQTGEATSAPTLRSGDGEIDWALPAAQVSARIRGVTPAPGAWTRGPGGTRFKIGPVRAVEEAPLNPGEVRTTAHGVHVGTGTTPVRLEELAPPGKPWMAAADWARGLREEAFTFEGKK